MQQGIVNDGSSSDDDDDNEAPLLIAVDVDDEEDDAPLLVEVEAVNDDPLPPCPVTILSGFLGAGKTTLVQYILRSPDHGKRIAVIENEFGGSSSAEQESLSVESMIARDGATLDNLSDLIELPNGCVCCTVKDNLVTTLESLLDKRRDLDYILIEASGMANPGPIASLFWLDEALESRLRLDGVVTIVDAYHIQQQLNDTEEASQQIAYADRILLNKMDLVVSPNNNNNNDDGPGEDQRLSILQSIRSINPTAPMRETTYSTVPDLDWIMDAKCYDVDRAKEVDALLQQSSAAATTSLLSKQPMVPQQLYCMPVAVPPTTMMAASTEKHKHTSAVSTVALHLKGSVCPKRINAWLASLLWPNQDEDNAVLRARLESPDFDTTAHQATKAQDATQLFRIKGIISVSHDEADRKDQDNERFVNEDGLDVRRFIVQAVHDLWEIHPAGTELQWDRPLSDGSIASERACKLIFIGRNLRPDELQTGFEQCFVHP